MCLRLAEKLAEVLITEREGAPEHSVIFVGEIS